MLKYRNKRTVCLSKHPHSSKKEAGRCDLLTAMWQNGEISNLEQQPRFPLNVNGIHICDYIADFKYIDAEGHTIVEDTKGMRTSVYRLKSKLLRATWNIAIYET